ncbi:MAG TPA: hypothetical protein VHN14_11325 [Kofleriaceae bacterium]|jgi:hypothetical protein|nr:hypothetical protein [Kofleriaceae bacterium]
MKKARFLLPWIAMMGACGDGGDIGGEPRGEADAVRDAGRTGTDPSRVTSAARIADGLTRGLNAAGHDAAGDAGVDSCDRSVFDPAFDPNWVATSSTGPVKVWFDTRIAGQASVAASLAAEFETRIWKSLIDELHMRPPLPDAGEPFNGGDGRVDAYLVDMATYGLDDIDGRKNGRACPTRSTVKYSPSFLLLQRDLPEKELKATAAHELMHASQWAYPVAGPSLARYYWLAEATATWAEDYVYPKREEIDNEEQRYAPHYLKATLRPIDSRDPALGLHIDGSYLFFQFLAYTVGTATIPQIWEATDREADERTAVDVSIPGGFREQWPKFAKLLWNQDPVDKISFRHWDELTAVPTVAEDVEVKLDGTPQKYYLLAPNIEHLAIRYHKFRFADPHIRSVVFQNHMFAVTPVDPYRLTVQAFYRKQGSSIWEWEHWSDDGFREMLKPFCLDVTAERLEDLIVVVSNDHPTEDVKDLDPKLAPRLAVSNVGCWRYEGESSVSEQTSWPGISSSTYEAKGSATFERVPPDPTRLEGVRQLFWSQAGRPRPDDAVSGSARGHLQSTNGPCTTTSMGAGPIAANDGSLMIDLGFDLGLPRISRDVYMTGGSMLSTDWNLACDGATIDGGTRDESWEWLSAGSDGPAVVSPDGTIHGSRTETFDSGDFHSTRIVSWNLKPLRQ